MDEADRAQVLEEGERAAAIARLRQATGAGADVCLCCGEPIPAARRRALPSACLCLPCQEEFERSVRR